MHPIVVKMRKQKITLNRWAKAHGFNQSYCSMVISGKRGILEFGKALEIIDALKIGGFWIEPASDNKE